MCCPAFASSSLDVATVMQDTDDEGMAPMQYTLLRSQPAYVPTTASGKALRV
jgi:hypothetical protein